jgi:hypothetical protein
VDDDGCCPSGCKAADNDCGALCGDLLTDVSVWNAPARGIAIGDYTNGTLDWIGCAWSCPPNSFYCNDLEDGIQFGTNDPSLGNALRALIDPGNAGGDTIPTGPVECCSAQSPRAVCNAPSQLSDPNSPSALCKALGYDNMVIVRQGTNNFCPNAVALTADGSDWSSDFDTGQLDWIAEVRCTE